MNKTIAAVILMAVAGTVHAGDFTLDGVKAGEVRGVAFEMSAPAAERVYTSAQAAITMAEREYLLRSDVRASGLAWQLMANDGVQDPQLTPKVFASYYRKAASKMAAKPEAGAPSPAATEAAVALLKKYCEIYDAAAKKARTLDLRRAVQRRGGRDVQGSRPLLTLQGGRPGQPAPGGVRFCVQPGEESRGRCGQRHGQA